MELFDHFEPRCCRSQRGETGGANGFAMCSMHRCACSRIFEACKLDWPVSEEPAECQPPMYLKSK